MRGADALGTRSTVQASESAKAPIEVGRNYVIGRCHFAKVSSKARITLEIMGFSKRTRRTRVVLVLHTIMRRPSAGHCGKEKFIPQFKGGAREFQVRLPELAQPLPAHRRRLGLGVGFYKVFKGFTGCLGVLEFDLAVGQ